jgi:hypothetical protein
VIILKESTDGGQGSDASIGRMGERNSNPTKSKRGLKDTVDRKSPVKPTVRTQSAD